MRRAAVVGVVVFALAGAVGPGVGPVPVGAQEASPRPTPEAAVANNWATSSMGVENICAVTTGGRLYCLGEDEHGAVGDGAPVQDQDDFVEVRGGGTDWSQVSVGGNHACAVKTTGRLFCWGDDDQGQLGDGGGHADKDGPTAVAGTTWTSVSAGRTHTCARKATGEIFCWGDDLFDQLGQGTGEHDRLSPVRVGTATNWSAVSAGGIHTCGRRTTGRLYCWGSDQEGSVGDGGTDDPRVPTPVEVDGGATNWSAVSAGDTHTCARKTNGRLYCWGDDTGAALGDGGADADRGSPTQVSGAATNWSSVSAGDDVTCARKTTGELFCWGRDNSGQLGNGEPRTGSGVPVGIAGAASDWHSVEVGGGACARKNAGRLLCWGLLPDQTPSSPVEMASATAFTTVAVGESHSCGISTAHRLYCWGEGSLGQLGSGTSTDQSLPFEVTGDVTTWTSVSLGSTHTCGLRSTGRLYCWGDDGVGQLGDDGTLAGSPTPVQVAGGFTDWTVVSTAFDHTCARREIGRLYCWGDDGSGQLGNGGANQDEPTPVEVAGALTTWATYVATGDAHTCALKNTGRLFCWGADGAGQLGTGGGDGTSGVPVQVSGGAVNWESVSAGGDHTCALKQTSRLYCWGEDDDGEGGNGGAAVPAVQTPSEVAGAARDWTSVDAGSDHACARKDSGRILCWGSDDDGRLGVAATDVDVLSPVEIDGALTRWSMVAAGGAHTCARSNGGRILCWGADDHQQTGADFDVDDDPTPVQVTF